MIATNRSSPSVASLRKILGGLGVTMSRFFGPDTPHPQTVVFRPQGLRDLTVRLYSTLGDPRGRITLRQVGDACAHDLQILSERDEPGADTGAQMLEHASHEGGAVVTGETEIRVAQERRIPRAGDSYLCGSTQAHRFRNIGDQEAVMVSACSPAYLWAQRRDRCAMRHQPSSVRT